MNTRTLITMQHPTIPLIPRTVFRPLGLNSTETTCTGTVLLHEYDSVKDYRNHQRRIQRALARIK